MNLDLIVESKSISNRLLICIYGNSIFIDYSESMFCICEWRRRRRRKTEQIGMRIVYWARSYSRPIEWMSNEKLEHCCSHSILSLIANQKKIT